MHYVKECAKCGRWPIHAAHLLCPDCDSTPTGSPSAATPAQGLEPGTRVTNTSDTPAPAPAYSRGELAVLEVEENSSLAQMIFADAPNGPAKCEDLPSVFAKEPAAAEVLINPFNEPLEGKIRAAAEVTRLHEQITTLRRELSEAKAEIANDHVVWKTQFAQELANAIKERDEAKLEVEELKIKNAKLQSVVLGGKWKDE